MQKNKKILITGINGYIGSNLARYLSDQGWQIAGIVRKNSNLNSIENIVNNLELATYNGAVSSLIKFIKKFNPNIVCHLASCF